MRTNIVIDDALMEEALQAKRRKDEARSRRIGTRDTDQAQQAGAHSNRSRYAEVGR